MATKRGVLGYRRSLISTPTYMDGLLVNNYWDSAKSPIASAWTLSNSDLTAARTTGSGWVSGFAKYYQPLDRTSVFEARLDGSIGGSVIGFSVADPISTYASGYPGNIANSGGVYWTAGNAGAIFKNGVSSPIGSINIAEAEWILGDVLGFGYDPVLGTMKLWRNGNPVYSGAPVFTGLIGKKITPIVGLYNIGDKVTLLSGKTLKYKYSGYSLSNEGMMEPSRAVRTIDSYRKHASAVIGENGYSVYVTSSTNATGYITPAFPTNKKTVIEFIAHNIAAATHVGFMFDEANKSGPRTGVLGQLTNSVALYIGGSSRGTFAANGCTQNMATLIGGVSGVAPGDVFGFGYDPVARTIKGWKNGVALNSGNPIWSNLPVAEVSAAYSLNGSASRVRLNPDALRYNYGDYTE